VNKKVVGVAVLLAVVAALTTLQSWDPEQQRYTFLSAFNVENLLQRVGLYGVLALGAAFVIVTGGIDLSIGAVVCVAGCTLPWLLRDLGWSGLPALLAVVAGCALIGAWHGVLIVGLRLQPFVVTLCGLMLYRGLMRPFTDDQTMGFGGSASVLTELAAGKLPLTASFGLPFPFLLTLALAAVTGVAWTRTVWGRHLFATGRNEEAARLAGVPTRRLVVQAYVVCSALAGFGGCLFALDVGSVQASSFGSFYELYAIAGAVLGGVALRGGEGSVLGVLLGIALMQLLPNAIRHVFDSDKLEFVVVGGVILAGAIADEVLRRWWGRRARRER
jgi:ribose transport system permease protein